jgi:hypothetical protein
MVDTVDFALEMKIKSVFKKRYGVLGFSEVGSQKGQHGEQAHNSESVSIKEAAKSDLPGLGVPVGE